MGIVPGFVNADVVMVSERWQSMVVFTPAVVVAHVPSFVDGILVMVVVCEWRLLIHGDNRCSHCRWWRHGSNLRSTIGDNKMVVFPRTGMVLDFMDNGVRREEARGKITM
jgi:hypothetical protein